MGIPYKVKSILGAIVLSVGFASEVCASPDPSSELAKKISALNKAGNYKEAIAAASAQLQKEPKWTRGYDLRGDALCGQKEFAAACEDYCRVLAVTPTDKLVLTKRSSARCTAGDMIGAIEDAQEALRLDPEYGRARADLAFYYWVMNDPKHALSEYTAAIGGKHNTPEETMYIKSERGTLRLVQGDYAGCIEDCAPAIAGGVRSAMGNAALAQYFMGHFDESIALIKEVVKKAEEPNCVSCQTLQLAFLAGARKAKEAKQVSLELLKNPKLDPNVRIFALLCSGDEKQALDAVEHRACSTYKDYMFQAAMFSLFHVPQKALLSCAIAKEMEPQPDASFYEVRALAKLDQKRYEEAIVDLEAAEKLTTDRVAKGELYFWQSEAESKLGRLGQSTHHADLAKEYGFQANPSATNAENLAIVVLRSMQEDRAPKFVRLSVKQ